MDKEQMALLSLIRNALHDEKKVEIQVSDMEWNKVFSYAKRQNILPIIVDEASKMPNVKEDNCFKQYHTLSLKMVLGQAKKTEYFLKIYKQFTNQGIYPIVMKGLICRKLYQKYANHRLSSDEDILIKKENFDAVKNILEKNGYVCESSDITWKQLEEVQEITFRNPKLGLSMEVHVNPIGHENAIRDVMNDFFTDVFENSIFEEFTNSKREVINVRTMDHTNHFLFLILHAFRHFTASGFGLRQCMDILIFQERYAEKIDWDIIQKRLKQVGALQFLADIQWIGNTYMGFTHALITSQNCPMDLLEDLLLNGVFGNETQAQRTAIGLTNATVSVETEKTHFIKKWFFTIFPQKERMINRHPELADKPWLLPIFWVKRIRRLLIHKKEADGDLLAESIKISNRRVALLRKYKVVS